MWFDVEPMLQLELDFTGLVYTGWDSTTALHYFTSMWSHRFLFVMRSAEMNKRDTIEV